jgi:hypothetical protein
MSDSSIVARLLLFRAVGSLDSFLIEVFSEGGSPDEMAVARALDAPLSSIPESGEEFEF